MGAADNNKTPLTVLTDLHRQENCRRYPALPDHARATPNYTDRTANGLTKCIIDFIRFTGGQAERINCTGRAIDQRYTFTDVIGNCRTVGSVKYIKTSGQRGTADISATIQGRSVKIEVKTGRDKQRPEQREYQRQIEASGGMYVIATTFQHFYTWYGQTFGRVAI